MLSSRDVAVIVTVIFGIRAALSAAGIVVSLARQHCSNRTVGTVLGQAGCCERPLPSSRSGRGDSAEKRLAISWFLHRAADFRRCYFTLQQQGGRLCSAWKRRDFPKRFERSRAQLSCTRAVNAATRATPGSCRPRRQSGRPLWQKVHQRSGRRPWKGSAARGKTAGRAVALLRLRLQRHLRQLRLRLQRHLRQLRIQPQCVWPAGRPGCGGCRVQGQRTGRPGRSGGADSRTRRNLWDVATRRARTWRCAVKTAPRWCAAGRGARRLSTCTRRVGRRGPQIATRLPQGMAVQVPGAPSTSDGRSLPQHSAAWRVRWKRRSGSSHAGRQTSSTAKCATTRTASLRRQLQQRSLGSDLNAAAGATGGGLAGRGASCAPRGEQIGRARREARRLGRVSRCNIARTRGRRAALK